MLFRTIRNTKWSAATLILDNRTVFHQNMSRKKLNPLAAYCGRPRIPPINAAHAARRKVRFDEACCSKTKQELMHNQRIKEYPQGFLEVLTCSRPIFREPGYEPQGFWSKSPHLRRDDFGPGPAEANEAAAGGPVSEANKAENVRRAVRRAKRNLRDLALCNEMKYFVTLTLDQAVIDRHDMAAITRKLNAWCSNQVQRCGLAYILVPERHKDGAVHFHGFINDAMEVVDSGTLSVPWAKKPRRPRSKAQRAEWLAKGGHVVYNLPGWPLGFTTAIELYGDTIAAVNYCCKYVGKQQAAESSGEAGSPSLPEKIGGRWFYHGGCRNKPEVRYNDVDFDEMPLFDGAFAWEVPAANAVFIKEKVNL